MTEEYLRKHVRKNAIFNARARLVALVHEALHSEDSSSGEQVPAKSTFRHKNRAASHYQQLLYSHSGDKNGVCFFVGCNYGTSVWTNPHKANRLLVAMSSPPSKYTKPDALVNRGFSSTNFCTGNPEPWVSLELLDGHKLICNYYWIRQDGSSAFPRSWALQASNDPEIDGWTDLRVHKADPSIHQPGQDAAWPVFGKAARTPYRCFRLVLQGPSYNSQHHMAISGLELYGYFI
mmetsp:Transcript_524/g.1835  ORF Transcript_524/g.1835 Transcript_524/m.1835 type:complete len:234 (-) Transcript_524:34-735(-)